MNLQSSASSAIIKTANVIKNYFPHYNLPTLNEEDCDIDRLSVYFNSLVQNLIKERATIHKIMKDNELYRSSLEKSESIIRQLKQENERIQEEQLGNQ